MRRFEVSLSINPGVFEQENGPEKGRIIAEVEDGDEPPKQSYFNMACTEFDLGWPRISEPLPCLSPFDPAGWRCTKIGRYTFWTDREANAFSA